MVIEMWVENAWFEKRTDTSILRSFGAVLFESWGLHRYIEMAR
jgi:hypothetical protein